MQQGLIFMQDNAPGHAAAITIEDLRERGIDIVQWPPFSPDLNPIETVELDEGLDTISLWASRVQLQPASRGCEGGMGGNYD